MPILKPIWTVIWQGKGYLPKGFYVLGFLGLALFLTGGSDRSASPFYHPGIRLNQVGFYPDGPKRAVIKSAEALTFSIWTLNPEKEVYEGPMQDVRLWDYSKEKVRIADFSDFQESGKYVLKVPGLGQSFPFEIKEKVHHSLLRAVLRSFYYMRCSADLQAAQADKWTHPMAHPDRSVLVHESASSSLRPTGSVIASPGGWYDAGDYGKYVPTATFATWVMLHMYERYPALCRSLDLNIPESNNDQPDVLDEALWSLRWLLSMQEPEEGFVYHKLTTAKHARKVMPEVDTGPRYVIGKNTAASWGLAAVAAQAARIFKETNPSLADSCLKAAEKAWNWGLENPEVIFENPEGIHTGACKDNFFEDEKRWAATELYLTTLKADYLLSVNLDEIRLKRIPNRRNVNALPYMSLLIHPDIWKNIDPQQRYLRKISILADRFEKHSREVSAYHVPLGEKPSDFNWGSNGFAAGMGTVLMSAFEATQKPEYLHASIDAIDYILGRNATGYCFVTGAGTQSPQHIHHRISEADQISDPVPGLMAGGPQNRVNRDKCTYDQIHPATRYLDAWCSYTTNEVAINWNASLLFLLACLEGNAVNSD